MTVFVIANPGSQQVEKIENFVTNTPKVKNPISSWIMDHGQCHIV